MRLHASQSMAWENSAGSARDKDRETSQCRRVGRGHASIVVSVIDELADESLLEQKRRFLRAERRVKDLDVVEFGLKPSG